ncbi:MAG: hypothetical protein ACKOWQ_01540 [Aquirufa sp.]
MKIRLWLICLFALGINNLYGQTANYKAQLNKKLKDQIHLKKEIKNGQMEEIDQNQSPKYRKRKALLSWKDSSTTKHQSYKQQNRPK